MNLGGRSVSTRWEYLLPALASASLIVSCIIFSSKKFFWNDELLSYLLLNDPSFRHMLVAMRDQFQGAPPLYFILGWPWVQAFGSSELSLRLFSSLGMCVACVTMWLTLRRNYNFWSASIGTLAVICSADLIFDQNAEARMYGLFVAVCALGISQFDLINRDGGDSRGAIVLNSLIHASIVLTHLFGIFYSGAILAAFIVRDRLFGNFRPRIYLSIIAGWLAIVAFIPIILSQADLTRPRSWIPVPILHDLVQFFGLSEFFPFAVLFLILISAVGVILRARSKGDLEAEEALYPNTRELSLVILAGFFLAIPVFVFVLSRAVTPLFIHRYLIPSTLGWSILLGYLSSRITLPALRPSRRTSGAAAATLILSVVLISFLLLRPINSAASKTKSSVPGANDNKYGHTDLPVVTQSSHDFTERLHYSPERHRYFYVLDWQVALASAPLFATGEHKTMEGFRRRYPDAFGKQIVEGEHFLKTHHRFLVLNFAPGWLHMRVMTDPRYKVTLLGDIDPIKQLFLVEAQSSGKPVKGPEQIR